MSRLVFPIRRVSHVGRRASHWRPLRQIQRRSSVLHERRRANQRAGDRSTVGGGVCKRVLVPAGGAGTDQTCSEISPFLLRTTKHTGRPAASRSCFRCHRPAKPALANFISTTCPPGPNHRSQPQTENLVKRGRAWFISSICPAAIQPPRSESSSSNTLYTPHALPAPTISRRSQSPPDCIILLFAICNCNHQPSRATSSRTRFYVCAIRRLTANRETG
jgi:hypothetical protein